MNTILYILNGLIWLATFIIGILWYLKPANVHFEPLTFLLGMISMVVTTVLAWKPTSNWIAKKKDHILNERIRAIPIGPDHQKLLECFNKNNVDYLVFGGFAGLVYNKIRITHDLDIWVGYHLDNHKRLISALASIGVGLSHELIDKNKASGTSIRLGTDPIDLYFKERLGSIDFYVFYSRRNTLLINGIIVTFISQADNRQQTSNNFGTI